jgi:hypothetical protein
MRVIAAILEQAQIQKALNDLGQVTTASAAWGGAKAVRRADVV